MQTVASRSKREGRGRRLDEIAEALPQRASAISRLFLAHSTVEISRTETNVIAALAAQPRRITELARGEGLTQPAMTLLAKRLEERGWVTRTTDPQDRRAVLVRLTEDGAEIYARLRLEYRALLHEEMATLPDVDVQTLAASVEILDRLIVRLSEREL